MQLLAPVSSYESAKLQIESGATELYVGGNTEVLKNFNFSGRGKVNVDQVKTFADDDELKEIITYAHEHQVKVMYAANFPFIANDPNGDRTFAAAFLEYIKKGVDYGVDSLILGDIGTILLCRKEGIQTHITSSSFLETINLDQIYFLKELGVDRAVLSYQMKLEEIEKIAKERIMETEVFGHFGCSFYDGYCNLKHFYGETKECGIGTPCQSNYQIVDQEGHEKSKGTCFNFALICSICSLQRFIRAGVDSVKLVGRSKKVEENLKITRVYADMIALIERNIKCSEAEIEALVQSELPTWWKRIYCRKKLCKYVDNSVTNSYV